MNFIENLGRRCDLIQRRRSPYPPLAWMEMPDSTFPIVSDPARCRQLEEDAERRRTEELRKVDQFHAKVCDRLRKLNLHEKSRCHSPVESDFRTWTARSISPEIAYLEGLPAAHSLTPTHSIPRLSRSSTFNDEARQQLRLRSVRALSAVRDRQQARQWREDSAKKRYYSEIRRRERTIAKLKEESLREQDKMDYLKGVEREIVEKEAKIYATEMKRLIASRLLRRAGSTAPPCSDAITAPYDPDRPLGLSAVLSLETRRQLRRLPPLCPCTSDWWETNPDKCKCSLTNNWQECSVGLEKLMSLSVHGSHCF